MPQILRILAAASIGTLVACAGAAAQTDPMTKPAGAHAKSHKPRVNARSAPSAPSPAGNLNAPSTDFSNVEADTGEPHQRRQNGPNVRPSIDSNGHPVMGVGF